MDPLGSAPGVADALQRGIAVYASSVVQANGNRIDDDLLRALALQDEEMFDRVVVWWEERPLGASPLPNGWVVSILYPPPRPTSVLSTLLGGK